MPTTFFLIAVLLSLLVHLFLLVAQWVSQPWNLTGLVPLGLGVWLNLSADRQFKAANTTVKPFEVSTVLVKSGAFRVTRNPMYLGFVSILLGEAILLRSLSPLIVAIAYAVLVKVKFISIEERMLADRFGTEWEEYASKVRRWL